MIVNSLGIELNDGTYLPMSFLQSANAFNQTLFVSSPGRRVLDNDTGFLIDGIYKADGLLIYKDKNDVARFYQAFESSGTFTVPSGVTAVRVLVCGAGGGCGSAALLADGSVNPSSPGTPGGFGGLVYAKVPTTPGESITVTVGAAVNNSGGGTSTFGSYSATGGARGNSSGAPGANGVGSGPTPIFTGSAFNWSELFSTYFNHRILDTYDSINMYNKKTQASSRSSSTSAIAWSFAGSFCPGARAIPNNSYEAVGGAVIVFWS